MHFVSTSDGLRCGFGQSDIPYFSFFHKFSHSTDSIFNRSIRVNSMLIVKVDDIHTKSLKTCFAGTSDIFRLAVNSQKTSVSTSYISEFCRKHNFIPLSFQCFSDKLFIFTDTIHICRVKKIDSELNCSVNSSDRFFFISLSIEFGHTHTTEPDSGNIKFALS